MSLMVLIVQILFTIPLTLIMNYLNKKDNSFIDKIVVPTLYIIVISILVPYVKNNVFLIVIFEILLSNFYVMSFYEESVRVNKLSFLSKFLSVLLSIFTYNYFISEVDSLIPSGESLKVLIWFLIILYLFSIYIRNKEEIKSFQRKQQYKDEKEYILVLYTRFKNKYNKYVNSNNKKVNALLYAIMIYEYMDTFIFIYKIRSWLGTVLNKYSNDKKMIFSSFSYISEEEVIRNKLLKLESKMRKEKRQFNLDVLLDDYSELCRDKIKKVFYVVCDFIKK